MDYQYQRKKLVNWLRSQLTGDLGEGEILTGSSPLDRYFTGILFPLSQYEDAEEDTPDNDDPDSAQSIRSTRRYQPPCSAGMSFFLAGNKITLRVYYSAWSFAPEGKSHYRNIKGWVKSCLTEDGGEEVVFKKPDTLATTHSETREVLNNRGKINILWRLHGKGCIVTVSLTNTANISGDPSNASNSAPQNYKVEQCRSALFNVEFKVDQQTF